MSLKIDESERFHPNYQIKSLVSNIRCSVVLIGFESWIATSCFKLFHCCFAPDNLTSLENITHEHSQFYLSIGEA